MKTRTDARRADADTGADRLLRMHDVESAVGLKRTTIYLRVRQGQFPAPIRLGGNTVAWSQRDVQAWMAERRAEGWVTTARGNAGPCRPGGKAGEASA